MVGPRRIGILAGGGRLPREIADSVAARGLPLHIVALDGEADADFGPNPVTRVNWGEIGRMVSTFKAAGVTDLVIIGGVKRPDLATIKPDLGFVRAIGTVLRLVLAGGDDNVLRGVIAFFEGQGFRVLGPADVAPELVIGAGNFTGTPEVAALSADAQLGFDIIAALGRYDIGQAAVISDGHLEALEAAEGTDRMLARLGVQRRAQGHSLAVARGVLVKRTKPGQDRRIDLPVIGPDTVTRAVEAGLQALAVEAGSALAADRSALLERARESGITVVGVAIDTASHEPLGGRAGRRVQSMTARAWTSLQYRSRARALDLQQLGRHPIIMRTARDVLKGREVIDALAAFGGSRAVVVVRGHVLSVETGEGVAAALDRASGLRQWGDRRLRRRAGVVVIDAGRDCEPHLVEIVARGRFAGIVVRRRHFTAGVPAETITAADKAGLFLAGLTEAEADHV